MDENHVSLYRQRDTETLCFVLVKGNGIITTELLPVNIDRTVLDEWCYIGTEDYWYIYGVLPEQTDTIKLDVSSKVTLKFSLADKCFLLVSEAIPHTLEFQDGFSQPLKKLDFDNFFLPLFQETRLQRWITRFFSRFHPTPKDPSQPVPLQRRKFF